MKFKLNAPFEPTGDQPEAIKQLTQGVKQGDDNQVLLGVTGSGKTYTVANVIENTQKPTLVISHNKTLAAQLYQEFRDFFPNNSVGFFISYYDYYLPESYIPQTDTYIAKETEVNEEIDKLRLQATSNIFSKDDVIIVASVSCIYNLGSPAEYGRYVMELEVGQKMTMNKLTSRLVDLHYQGNKWEIDRGQFRQRGNRVEIYPAYKEEILGIEIKDNHISRIYTRPLLAGEKTEHDQYLLYPAKHYLTDPEKTEPAVKQIQQDLKKRVKELKKQDKLVEAQRLEQRVEHDLEMIQELGYVSGIENYSRYFDGREPGEPPYTLLDYFHHAYGDDFLIVIDESHITVPQIRGMYRGDKSRKETLIDFGFRLPSALDNRPLKFEEFLNRNSQTIFVSATPRDWEKQRSDSKVVEQLIRPTGLTEPEIDVRPTEDQVEDLIQEVVKRAENNERVLVTTLTKRLAEDLADFLANPKKTNNKKINVQYLHSDVDSLERSQILSDLRQGDYDVIVGVNLLREGLDLPEVTLVAILNADVSGFLRSKTALIQTMGRAARNSAGEVILYADNKTEAMEQAIDEVNRRRRIQKKYNQEHDITPQTIDKPIRGEVVPGWAKRKEQEIIEEIDPSSLTPKEINKKITELKRKMNKLAGELDFEKAAKVRDQLKELKQWQM
jgi:excinuclease ABC subunit B